MPSKKNKPARVKLDDIWSFIQEVNDKELLSEMSSIYFPDSYIEKCVLSQIKKALEYQYISSSEIDTDWLNSQFLNPSLFSFGDRNNYLIGRGEVLKKDVMNYLKDSDFKNLEHNLLVSVTGQDKNFTDLLKSEKEISSFRVVYPNFWEGEQLLRFFAKCLDIKLAPNCYSFLCNTLDFKSDVYYESLEKLKLFRDEGSGEVDLKICKNIITHFKIDQFELADLFSNKKIKEFYQNFAKRPFDPDWFRMFCSFMQGHLFKILDPSYTEKKNKLTKYDQKIIRYSKNWDRNELLDQMRQFGKFEIMAKRKDPFLIHEIKRRSF